MHENMMLLFLSAADNSRQTCHRSIAVESPRTCVHSRSVPQLYHPTDSRLCCIVLSHSEEIPPEFLTTVRLVAGAHS